MRDAEGRLSKILHAVARLALVRDWLSASPVFYEGEVSLVTMRCRSMYTLMACAFYDSPINPR